jgi:hypothetical protein
MNLSVPSVLMSKSVQLLFQKNVKVAPMLFEPEFNQYYPATAESALALIVGKVYFTICVRTTFNNFSCVRATVMKPLASAFQHHHR